MAFKAALLFLFVAAAAAVPLQQIPTSFCNRNCLLNDLSKFRYAEGKTYRYELESDSIVAVKSIEHLKQQLKWTATVDLHFITPCEVTLQIIDPKLEGRPNAAFTKELTSYPLKAVLFDGTFDTVCAHFDDAIPAVNIKKGILSVLQNSLPSNSSQHDGLIIHETDVVGVCPTVYNVRRESEKVIVTKSKDHRLCSERVGGPSESPLSALPLRAPLPLNVSRSTCKQEIHAGIIQSVSCRDENEIVLLPGSSKPVVANQTLVMKLVPFVGEQTMLSLIHERKTNLIYDYIFTEKDPSATGEMESKLKEICTIIDSKWHMNQLSQKFSDFIMLLNNVEESAVGETLKKIIDSPNTFCRKRPSFKEIKSLYLDAVSKTSNPGAVVVMVDNILKGERVWQSTWRLHTIPRVCIHGVMAVKRVFENDTVPLPVTLAAGSIVSRFCATEGSHFGEQCVEINAVHQVMHIVSTKLQHSCTGTQKDRTKEWRSLALLKAMRNINNITEELRQSVLSCFRQPSSSLKVRLAAAATLKQSSCNEQATRSLISTALNREEDDELRIISYKAGIECASSEQIASLLNEATEIDNVQFRAYILSDMTNLQQSKAPYKRGISERLAPFNISQDYPINFRLFSRSFDVSKFTETKEFGFEISSDIIYGRNHHQLRSNFTIDLFKQIINVAEVGIRMENLPALLQKIVMPQSYFGKTEIGKLLWTQLQGYSSSSNDGELELFIKVLGQEIMYTDIHTRDYSEIDIMVELFTMIGQLIEKLRSGEHLQGYKGFHTRYDLHIPTIHGIPLHLTHDLTSVVSFDALSNLSGAESTMQISPVASFSVNSFVGYRFGPVVGFKLNNTLFSSSDSIVTIESKDRSLSVKLDFQKDEAELFSFENKGLMVVQLPGEEEQSKECGTRDSRLHSHWCSPKVAGLQLCTQYDISNPLKSADYPFVKSSTVKCVIKKESPSMRGFEMILGSKPNSDGYQVKFDIPGTNNHTKFALEVDIEKRSNEQELTIKSTVERRTSSLRIVHKFDYSSRGTTHKLEIFTGSPRTEKIFSAEASLSKKNETKLEMKTLGSLRNAVFVNVEVDAVVARPIYTMRDFLMNIHLRTLEISMSAGKFSTENFYREIIHSERKSEYRSRAETSYDGVQTYLMEMNSTLDKLNEGYEMKSKVKVGNEKKRSLATLYLINSPLKKILNISATSESGSEKYLTLTAFDIKQLSQNRLSVLALDIPKRNINWSMKSYIRGSPARQFLDFAVKSQATELMIIRGPFSYSVSAAEIKQEMELGIRFGEREATYHIASEIDMTKEKNLVKVRASEGQKQLINYSHELQLSKASPSLVSNLEIPDVLKTRLNLKKTESHMEADVEVKLEVYAPRHVQARMAIDTSSPSEGHVTGMVFLDKARDPENKAQLTASYNFEKKKNLLVHGDLTVRHEIYQFSSTFYNNTESWMKFEQHYEIEVTKNSEKVFIIRSIYAVDVETEKDIKIDCELFLMTPDQKEYALRKRVVITQMSSPFDIKVDITARASELGKVSSTTEVSIAGGQQTIELSVHGQLEVKGANKQEVALITYNGHSKQRTEDSQLVNAGIDVKVNVSGHDYELAVTTNRAAMETRIVYKLDDKQLLRGELKRIGQNRLVGELDVLSRSLEVSGEFSRAHTSISLYPNRHQRDEKYDLDITMHDSDEENLLNVAIEYPHGGRQRKVAGILSIKQNETVGALNVDVFTTESRAIKLRVNGIRLAEGVYRVETTLHSGNSEDGPTLTVDVSVASGENIFYVTYRKDSRTIPSVFVSSKYIKQSDSAGVVSFIVNTPQNKFEFGGIVTEESNYGCRGHKLNSTMESMSGQKYQLEVVMCSPGFIKIITGAHGSSERYVIKLGLESLRHAEISVMKNVQEKAGNWWEKLSGSTEEKKEHPVIALSAKLVSPFTLALRVQYEEENFAPAMRQLKSELDSVMEGSSLLMRALTRAMGNDIRAYFPDDVLDAMRGAIDDLAEDPAVKQIVQICSDYLDTIVDYIKEYLRIFQKIIYDVSIRYKDELGDILVIMRRKVWISLDDVLDWLKYLTDHLGNLLMFSAPDWQVFIERLKQYSIVENIDTRIMQLCDKHHSLCEASNEFLKQYFGQLRGDLRQATNFLLSDKYIQDVGSLLRRFEEMVHNEEYSALLQSAVMLVSPPNAGLLIEESSVTLNLPLRQPVSSLLAAATNIGFSSRYKIHQLHTGLFNKQETLPIQLFKGEFIMKLDGLMLTTVQKSHIQLPPSHCEYHLFDALDESGSASWVTFENSTYPDYALTFNHMNHSIKLEINKENVTVDGQQKSADFNLNIIPNELSAVYSKGKLTVVSPQLTWTADVPEKHSMVQVNCHGSGLGIGFYSYPTNSTPQELLDMFVYFQTDRYCIP